MLLKRELSWTTCQERWCRGSLIQPQRPKQVVIRSLLFLVNVIGLNQTIPQSRAFLRWKSVVSWFAMMMASPHRLKSRQNSGPGLRMFFCEMRALRSSLPSKEPVFTTTIRQASGMPFLGAPQKNIELPLMVRIFGRSGKQFCSL